MRDFKIERPAENLREAIQNKIDNLNKPKGSLGLLEELAMHICLVQQTLQPQLKNPTHLLIGGDHGIEREGVSVTPREVTWQQMINYTLGGGGVNLFCRQHGFKLRIIDAGVDHDLSPFYMEEEQGAGGILNRKIAWGTRDFLYEPAMTETEMEQAIEVGVREVDACIEAGCNILCIGEMGAANTSPSSIWMSLFCGIPLAECVGVGSGLDSEGISRKRKVLEEALGRYRIWHKYDPESTTRVDILTAVRYFGGYEMVAAIGSMLRAAERGILVMIDGFIMTACALACTRLYPDSQSYMIFGHMGDEGGHARMLRFLQAKPLLALGMRLGEGTGALCAYPIIESAVRMMNEMNDFEHARITKYF